MNLFAVFYSIGRTSRNIGYESINTNDIFPTALEIKSMKDNLPIKVDEDFEWYDVSYSDKLLIFKYRILIDMDEDLVNQAKSKEYSANIKKMMLTTMLNDKDKMYQRVRKPWQVGQAWQD